MKELRKHPRVVNTRKDANGRTHYQVFLQEYDNAIASITLHHEWRDMTPEGYRWGDPYNEDEGHTAGLYFAHLLNRYACEEDDDDEQVECEERWLRDNADKLPKASEALEQVFEALHTCDKDFAYELSLVYGDKDHFVETPERVRKA